ncbi:MAG: PTS transporter subunit EIIB [Streptococcus thermophilus]
MTENELGKLILQGLGGAGNIQSDNCISRLRLVLKDTATIDEHILKRPAQWESLKLTKIIYKCYMEDK